MGIDEPTSFQEAINSPNNKERMDTIRVKMNFVMRNQVLEIIDFPSQHKSIRNKCIFEIKR